MCWTHLRSRPIEVWPFFELEAKAEAIKTLSAAEYTVFQQVRQRSTFKAVLNEEDIAETDAVQLPQSYKGRIIPAELYESRKHPDVRIARRAATIANLAKVISERNVSKGLLRTLVTQARRLEGLAKKRLHEIRGKIPIEGS